MTKSFALRGDKIIWMVVFILSVFSALAVYSSTETLAFKYQGGNTLYYVTKHTSLLLLGILFMIGTHNIKYTYFSRISQLLIYISVPLLLFTLVKGTNLNEASRWITLPVINLSFQTSDIAKLALIMYLARVLAKKQEKMDDFKSGFMPIIIPILGVVGLILPANFSTAAVLFMTSTILLFIGKVHVKFLGMIFASGIVGILLIILIANTYPKLLPRSETWLSRIENFSSGDSEGNYQVEQSKIAIVRGGILGKLPGHSLQRNFLPHPYSDFIFAIIIEEYGLVGAAFVVLMYMILLMRAIKIARNSPGTFAAFLTIGLAFSLVFQAFINMGVAVNLFPVTGQPLPLLSMGGTSLWFTSISIGIILSVSREVEPKSITNEQE